MDSWRSLPPGQLAELARALGGLRWSWSVTDVDAVLAHLGWTVAAGPTDACVIARTGFAPSDGLAEIGFDIDGRTVTERVDDVRGTAENPMTRDEVIAKARDLITPVLGPQTFDKLVARVFDLERLRSVRELRPLIQKA